MPNSSRKTIFTTISIDKETAALVEKICKRYSLKKSEVVKLAFGYIDKAHINPSEAPESVKSELAKINKRQDDIIDSNKNIEFKSSIGFGNMLTDWSEVLVERDADANAYPDISIEVIELYRSKLVNSIQCAWSRTITSQKDFEYLYLQIKLFINKEITELLTKKNIPNYIALANLLYETKTEMSLQH